MSERRVKITKSNKDPLPRRCMTTLTAEMEAALPVIERATGFNISDILKAGYVKVAREIQETGKLVIEPMPVIAVRELQTV